MATLDVVNQNLASYTYVNGGWYSLRRGYTDTTNSTYFFQYGSAPGNAYNLNVTVSITSTVSSVYTPNANIIDNT